MTTILLALMLIFGQQYSRSYGSPDPAGVKTDIKTPVGTYRVGTGTITVTPAVVTVTVLDQTTRQGRFQVPWPAFTSSIKSGTHVGLFNGDAFEIHYSTTATWNSPPGKYPITATITAERFAKTEMRNYKVTIVPGTLTILP